MALIICKECKAQVSDSAKTCPSCGAPVPKPTSRLAIFIAGFFGLVVFSVIYNSSSSSATPPSAVAAPQQLVTPIPKLDCVKDETTLLTRAEKQRELTPNVVIGYLAPCVTQTGNPLYVAQIALAEKQVKLNADAELQKTIELQKRANLEAKEQAKLKKSQGVKIGMTMEDALASSWGKPERINRTTTATMEREQWVYGSRSYLYFQNGLLTSIQN